MKCYDVGPNMHMPKSGNVIQDIEGEALRSFTTDIMCDRVKQKHQTSNSSFPKNSTNDADKYISLQNNL